jgi:hypothetical protein
MKSFLMKPIPREEPDVDDVLLTSEPTAPRGIAQNHEYLFSIHPEKDVSLDHLVANDRRQFTRFTEILFQPDTRPGGCGYMQAPGGQREARAEHYPENLCGGHLALLADIRIRSVLRVSAYVVVHRFSCRFLCRRHESWTSTNSCSRSSPDASGSAFGIPPN